MALRQYNISEKLLIKFLMVLGVIFFILMIVVIKNPGDGGKKSPQPSITQPSKQQEQPREIPKNIKETAIKGINVYLEVKESAIAQDGVTVSLIVIVNYQTSDEKAKELGDSFVRMVKTLSNDTNPSKEIGEGIYNYLITVAYPTEEVIVQGAKAGISPKITW